ncbi:hypothetical protein T439DRAFT_329373 [Meredithblackwellia eburnea MCA 4105]
MPPPRESRLQARKSLAVDPNQLHTSDGSDDESGLPAGTSPASQRRSKRFSEEAPPPGKKATASAGRKKAGEESVGGAAPSKRLKKGNASAVVGEDEPVRGSHSTTGKVSSGFAPRAAVAIAGARKPQPAFSHTFDDDDDDGLSFHFSNKPATPAGLKRSAAAALPSASRATKTQRTDASTSALPAAYPPTPPDHSRTTTGHDPLRGDGTMPLSILNTPVLERNRAMRNAATSERRNSRGSISRASRGGFDDSPHPEVAEDMLYRYTSPDDPVTVRLKKVLGWRAKRERQHQFPLGNQDSTAKSVVDGWISDLWNGRLSLVSRIDSSDSSTILPDHPTNIENLAKLDELKTNFANIQLEQKTRLKASIPYQEKARRAGLPLSVDGGQVNFDTVAAEDGPQTIEEALALGKKLLVTVGSRRKEKGKEREKTEKEKEKLEDEEMKEVAILTSSFRQLTHRQAELCRLAGQFVDARIHQTHHALSSDAQQGLQNASASSLSATIPRTGSATGQPVPGPDPRDLLRAIANSDQQRR